MSRKTRKETWLEMGGFLCLSQDNPPFIMTWYKKEEGGRKAEREGRAKSSPHFTPDSSKNDTCLESQIPGKPIFLIPKQVITLLHGCHCLGTSVQQSHWVLLTFSTSDKPP